MKYASCLKFFFIKGLPADGFTFETTESDLTVNEGQTIKLICILENVRDESLARVEWSKNNQKSITIAKGDQVVSDALKERVEVRRENVQSMLVIRDAKDEDAGEYVCTLAESEEKQERRFSVIVRGTKGQIITGFKTCFSRGSFNTVCQPVHPICQSRR